MSPYYVVEYYFIIPQFQVGEDKVPLEVSLLHLLRASPGVVRLVDYFERSVVLCSAPSVPQPVFTITGKVPPTRAFSWLKAPTSAFTFKTLLRHYASVVKSHHKFMLASYMMQIAKFLALLHHNASFFNFCIII